MGGSLARTEPLRLRVLAVVILVYLQNISPPDDHEGFIQIKAKHLIHREQPALSNAAGLTVLGRVVRHAPGIELLRLTGDIDADLSCARGNKFRREGIGAAEEQRNIAVPQYFLPLVIGISVLEPSQILEHTGHTDVPGPNNADFPGQVRNNPARAEFFAQYMHRHGERPARTVLIRIPYQFNKDERNYSVPTS